MSVPPAARGYLNSIKLGSVIVDIGQIDEPRRRALNAAVRRGEIARWRGRWHPTPGAPWGIGPRKTCWGLPQIAAHFAQYGEAK